MCWDCKHDMQGAPPRYSVVGHLLCPGCADRLDLAVCSLAATSGLFNPSATSLWIGRHRQNH